jgi:hypothetical protein
MANDLGQSDDPIRRFVEFVAAHKLVPGIYADAEHPYDEWVTEDGGELEFDYIVERARELLVPANASLWGQNAT